MPFCQYCGKEVSLNASFCPNCGHRITQIQSPTVSNELLGVANASVGNLLDLNDIVMKKKILSLREHYDFEDTSGRKVGEGDGNFFQVPAKFEIFDTTSNGKTELMRIQGKIISIRKQFTFFDLSGIELGTIKKKIVKLIGEEYWIEQNGTETVRIYGNFTEHDYKAEQNKQVVATVHKKWVALRDSFGISIMGPVDHRLMIGAVIAIEHNEVTERNRNNSF